MIALQILSDLHLEAPKAYDVFEIAPHAPYLALLGDIGCLSKDFDEYSNFLLVQLRQFKIVLLVLGNHEPYHSSWTVVKNSMAKSQENVELRKEGGEKLGKLVILDRTRFDIDVGDDKITVLGCTLFSHIPPESHDHVSFGVNDFYYTEEWDVEKHNQEHQHDLQWLNSQLEGLEGSGRKVVIFTHYSPTVDSRAEDPRHSKSAIKPGFETDLQNTSLWQHDAVKLWAFGHTHYNCDFKDDLGKRVYTNQRGYCFSQSPGFDATKVVEV
ncbi:Ser/Thr protein phosphatase superfamily protein [Xylariales sp. AK1849]|nr:Ser/Thr protein phosphatase superfamily protein [Xylariales sp. AK1849]